LSGLSAWFFPGRSTIRELPANSTHPIGYQPILIESKHITSFIYQARPKRQALISKMQDGDPVVTAQQNILMKLRQSCFIPGKIYRSSLPAFKLEFSPQAPSPSGYWKICHR
jgi:hypothetical protein